MRAQNQEITGEKLAQVCGLLEATLRYRIAADGEAAKLFSGRDPDPAFERGKAWLGKSSCFIREGIGNRSDPKPEVDARLRFLQQFGTCKKTLNAGNDKIYADFTSITLDALKPDLSREEKKRAAALLEALNDHLENVENVLKRPITMEEDDALKSDLARYKQEVVAGYQIASLQDKIALCGDAMDSLDTFTAVLLHAWVGSNSRDFQGYRDFTMKEFSNFAAGYRKLHASLEDAPYKGQEDGNNNLIDSQRNFKAALYILQHAPQNWISRDESKQCQEELKQAGALVKDNRTLLLHVMQARLYEQTCKALGRSY